MPICIRGTGAAVPKRIITNDEISKIGDTNDEWIRSRTGICERRILSPDENLENLAISASRQALKKSGISAGDLDLIIVGTFTPTNFTPNTACTVKVALGAEKAVAFDLNSACSGFVYSVWTAKAIMETNGYKRALIIGADALSKVVNWEDRSTFVLFGDGAGAAVLENTEDSAGKILSIDVRNVDDNGSLLVTGISEGTPFDDSPSEKSVIKMDGGSVFKFATGICVDMMKELADIAGKPVEEIQHFVPHQANGRIIDYAAGKLGVPIERFFKNVDKYGNTSAGSVPLALNEMMEEREPQSGDLVCVVAFGGGLTVGGFIFEI